MAKKVSVEKKDNIVDKKERRSRGAGSVYPLTSGKGFGYCIFLTSDKELRKKYGLKLRYLGTGKTYDEAERKCLEAISRKDELLQAKLEKLGHDFGTANSEDNQSAGEK